MGAASGATQKTWLHCARQARQNQRLLKRAQRYVFRAAYNEQTARVLAREDVERTAGDWSRNRIAGRKGQRRPVLKIQLNNKTTPSTRTASTPTTAEAATSPLRRAKRSKPLPKAF